MILETEYLKLRLAHFYCKGVHVKELSLEITLTVPLSYVSIKIFFLEFVLIFVILRFGVKTLMKVL